MNSIPLSTHFQSYFRVVLADSPELIERAQRIRYDVYCQEFHYEHEDNCPGGLEKDEYDQYSVHCIVVHTPTDTPTGCVRLIRAPRDNPDLLLPLEKYCGYSLTHPTLHPRYLARTSIVEVSRLAVHTTFRRRPGESESPLGRLSSLDFPEAERRTFPLISLALFAAGAVLLILTQRQNLFVMVEPRLAKRLQATGLPFVQIGDLLDYHGPRAAHYVTIQQILNGMHGELRELYSYVYDSLKADAMQTGFDLSN